MRPIYQIYVEEQLIDLDPKTIISITIQAADIASGDIISRKASFTNQIKVPATNTNIIIFGYANNPKSGSSFPFIKKMMKVICNGIQIMDGIVIIKSFDNYFNLQLYSIPKDLTYRVANLYLSDLDFGDSPITWNAAFIDSKRASTSGWCAPVLNYGQIDDTVAGDLSIGAYYLPCVSYKDTLTAILTNAGYTISGIFYNTDTTLSKMVLTYGREDFLSTTLTLNQALSTTILQSDFLKDFLIKFGAFFRFRNNDIEIVTLEEILNNTGGSIDWTLKRVKNKKDIVQYTLNGFTKKNNFRYTKPSIQNGYIDYDTIPNRIFDADGSLNVDNENLESSSDLYTSIFESPNFIPRTLGTPSIEAVVGTSSNIVRCVTSLIWSTFPASYTFENKPDAMLAYLDDKEAVEVNVKYNGSSRNDYKVARFNAQYSSARIIPSLTWRQSTIWHPSNGFLDVYYSSMQRILTAGTIVTTHEYNLTDIDINSLDLLTPIFDDGNYYLINKIVSYVSRKTTRVELLQI